MLTKVLNTPLLFKDKRGIFIVGPGLIAVFIFANFLTPTFPAITRGTLYFGTLVILSVIAILTVILIRHNYFKSHKVIFNTAFLVSSAFLLLTLFSLMVDYERVVFSDFIELIKPVAALAVFLCFYISVKTVSGLRTIVYAYSILFIIVALIGLLEAFGGLNRITHILYTRPRPILMGKAVSPFGITYFYATFMLFAATFYLSRFIARPKISLLTGLLFIFTTFAMLATQSRTLFLSYIAMIGFFVTLYNFYQLPGSKRVFKIFAPVIIFTVALIIAYFDVITSYFSYLYTGISRLVRLGIDPTGDGSANIRVSQIVWAWENAKGYAILGSGIGKGYQNLLESFYALYLYRYGFIGITIYIGIALIFLIKSYQAAKRAIAQKDFNLFAFFMALHVFIIVLPITSLASVITDQYIFMMLYYGSYGLTLKYLHITNIQIRKQAVS